VKKGEYFAFQTKNNKVAEILHHRQPPSLPRRDAMIGARRPYSSQMHSSHQDAGEGGFVRVRTYHLEIKTVQADSDETLHLPPASVGNPPGIHLAHITHSDDAHNCVAHDDRL
jgi:hypothetical protein